MNQTQHNTPNNTIPPTAFHRFRHRIYKMVELAKPGDLLSEAYDRLLIIFVVLSIFPLCFKETNALFESLEGMTIWFFVIDYLLRWFTCDFHHKRWGNEAFVRYPFTLFAIVDLLSILPAIPGMSRGVRLFRLLRMGQSLKTIRLMRYTTGFQVIYKAMKKEKQPLLAVLYLSLGYIFLTALLMFSVEPQSFRNFFDAIYWSVTTLTTVGYGDVYPVSNIGRFVSMISSFVGIAIVALPTGIITAGFMSELEEHYIQQEKIQREYEKQLKLENTPPPEDDDWKINHDV